MPTRWQIIRKVAKGPGFVLLVLTLYVGSTGPVGWLDQHGHIPKSAYSTWSFFYYPLRAIDHSPLRKPLQRYVKWWRQL